MGFIIHDILTLKELEHLKKSAIGQFERAATTTSDKKASTLTESLKLNQGTVVHILSLQAYAFNFLRTQSNSWLPNNQDSMRQLSRRLEIFTPKHPYDFSRSLFVIKPKNDG